MARTAIVNPRRRKKSRKSNKRRAYGRAAAPKRRRNPSRRRSSRRRRNPGTAGTSAYSAGGYRQKNPDMFNMDRIIDVTPAATAGIWAARWALKMAGPFNPSTAPASPTPRPGLKHAIAIVVAANVVQGLADSMLGHGKGTFAEIAALGFGGDLFARTVLFDDSQWVKDNLFLGDDEADDDDSDDLEGFESESALGEAQYAVGPDGTLYEMSGAPDPAFARDTMAGFESQSALGVWGGTPTQANSFGYV